MGLQVNKPLAIVLLFVALALFPILGESKGLELEPLSHQERKYLNLISVRPPSILDRNFSYASSFVLRYGTEAQVKIFESHLISQLKNCNCNNGAYNALLNRFKNRQRQLRLAQANKKTLNFKPTKKPVPTMETRAALVRLKSLKGTGRLGIAVSVMSLALEALASVRSQGPPRSYNAGAGGTNITQSKGVLTGTSTSAGRAKYQPDIVLMSK